MASPLWLRRPRAAQPAAPPAALRWSRWRWSCHAVDDRARRRHAGRPRPIVSPSAVGRRLAHRARGASLSRPARRSSAAVGNVILPVAALCALLPLASGTPHRFAYARRDVGRRAHRRGARRLRALHRRRAAGASADRTREAAPQRRRAARRPTAPFRCSRSSASCSGSSAAGFVLLTLTIASGLVFSEEVFGRPVDVHAQERVLGARLADVRRPPVRPLALRLARPAGPVLDPGGNGAARPRLPRQQVRLEVLLGR